MVTLFEHPLSPHGQKVKIALAERDIAGTAQVPDLLGSGADLVPDGMRQRTIRFGDELR